MSNALGKFLNSEQEGLKLVIGSFDLTAGAATVLTKNNRNNLWDVTKTGVGLYTVTFTNKYFADKVPSIEAWCQGSSATVQPNAHATAMLYTASARTLVIGTSVTLGTLADLAIASSLRIHFMAVFPDTRV